MVAERQRHRPGEVLDREISSKDLLEAGLGGDVLSLSSRLDTGLPRVVAEQPVEALGLQRKGSEPRGAPLIFAKEMRSGAVLAPLFVFAVEALREAAKGSPFRGLGLTTRVPVPSRAGGRPL